MLGPNLAPLDKMGWRRGGISRTFYRPYFQSGKSGGGGLKQFGLFSSFNPFPLLVSREEGEVSLLSQSLLSPWLEEGCGGGGLRSRSHKQSLSSLDPTPPPYFAREKQKRKEKGLS